MDGRAAGTADGPQAPPLVAHVIFRLSVGGLENGEVRGLGYLLGIECERPSGDVQKGLLERGILVGKAGEPNTIRLLPPLSNSCWMAITT